MCFHFRNSLSHFSLFFFFFLTGNHLRQLFPLFQWVLISLLRSDWLWPACWGWDEKFSCFLIVWWSWSFYFLSHVSILFTILFVIVWKVSTLSLLGLAIRVSMKKFGWQVILGRFSTLVVYLDLLSCWKRRSMVQIIIWSWPFVSMPTIILRLTKPNPLPLQPLLHPPTIQIKRLSQTQMYLLRSMLNFLNLLNWFSCCQSDCISSLFSCCLISLESLMIKFKILNLFHW